MRKTLLTTLLGLVSMVGAMAASTQHTDINGDGTTDKADAQLVYAYILGTADESVTLAQVDVNKDGEVNTADVVDIYVAAHPDYQMQTISINEDFTLCHAPDVRVSDRNLGILRDNLATLKEVTPAPIYEQLAGGFIYYRPERISINYVIEEDFHGVVVGRNLGALADSVKKNAPNYIVNIYARMLYQERMSEAQRTAVEEQYRKANGRYAQVYWSDGKKLVRGKVADAKADEEAYFAELSEAYLGTNNFYPFDREELERFDKEGFALMETIWGKVEIPTHPDGISMPPTSLKQHLQWRESELDPYYRKYLDANGMPIVASRFVADSALVQAKKIVIAMLEKIPEAQEHMLAAHFRVGIIGNNENVTDMPEYRVMPEVWPDTDWDARGRGYGATEYIPLMSCGEENIIMINRSERYWNESIMVHEFAHNVEFGLRKYHTEFCEALDAAFKNAVDNNLWCDKQGRPTYSRDNVSEYFAEGVQAWFDTCRMIVNINGKDTMLKYREQLKAYDPMLHDAIQMVMADRKLTGYHFNYEFK